MDNRERLKYKEVIEAQKQIEGEAVKALLVKEIKANHKKLIVLDDDPTGVQTVHGISVYTDWTKESIRKGFEEENNLFFILTNSRSFSREKTLAVHEEITSHILEIAEELNRDFCIMIRGDSTLRGHFPDETQKVKETVEANNKKVVDGEVLCPFFKEGGRFTFNNIHYVKEGEELVPSSETEFAKDKTFGYSSSHLGEWIEEKTTGSYKKNEVIYIGLEELRNLSIDEIEGKLLRTEHFNKVVVNALDCADLEVFCIALFRAMAKGKTFLFRIAASFVKVIGGIGDKTLLAKNDLMTLNNSHGGLIIVGSHTQKTTQQLEALKGLSGIEWIELNVHLVVEKEAFDKEIERVRNEAAILLKRAKAVVIYTRRKTLVLDTGNKEDELKIAVQISEGTANIVSQLETIPAFIVAKGGITSSDIGVKGLKVSCAKVVGQIKPGIPVWITDKKSKFPHLPYIIFPGNVGEVSTLKEIVETLIS